MAHDTRFHCAVFSTEENVFSTSKRTSKKTLQKFFSSVSFALELLCFLVPMVEYPCRAKIFVLRHDFIWAEEARLGRQIHYQPSEYQHKSSLKRTHSSNAIKGPINCRPRWKLQLNEIWGSDLLFSSWLSTASSLFNFWFKRSRYDHARRYFYRGPWIINDVSGSVRYLNL